MKFWALALASAILQVAATQKVAPEDGENDDLGHIVVLKKNIKDLHFDEHMKWVKSMQERRLLEKKGMGIKHIFKVGGRGFGYSGKFEPRMLAKIKAHDSVDYVEKDQLVEPPLVKKSKDPNDEPPAQEATSYEPNNGFGILTTGQGYNTFLEKGMMSDAVLLPKRSRDLPQDAEPEDLSGEIERKMFNFTEPSSTLTSSDIAELLAEPDLDAISRTILANVPEKQEEPAAKSIEVRADADTCEVHKTADYTLVSDYESYLKALDISLSASLAGFGDKASLSGSYLNRVQTNQQTLTYVAKIEIQRSPPVTRSGHVFNKKLYRPESFIQDFGDRWIRGFHLGGKMTARVTFTSKERLSKQEMTENAEGSMEFWGAQVNISTAVRSKMREASKHFNVHVSLFYEGALGHAMREAGSPSEIEEETASASLQKMKVWADQFMTNACKHEYPYKPILDEYPHIKKFPRSQKVANYDVAKEAAPKALNELVKMSMMAQHLRSLGEHKSRWNEIEIAYLQQVQKFRQWTENTALRPETALEEMATLLSQTNEFLDAFRPLLKSGVYVSGIELVFGPESPGNYLREINGQAADINHLLGGRYVWIVPIYTTNRDEACTSFDAVIQDSKLEGYENIAEGTYNENKKRYLRCNRSPEGVPIRKLALLRGGESLEDFNKVVDAGFEGRTGDINEGSGVGGAIMHLLWSYKP